MTRTLFITFEVDKWTELQLNNLMDSMEEATPDDVNVVACTEDIEYLTAEEARSFAEGILDGLEDGGDDEQDTLARE